MNKIILLGRLGKDAELRKTSDGKDMASFSLVTNRTYKDAAGTKKEDPEWHRVVKFNISPKFGELLRKGLDVLVEGRIKTRKYQDKLGKDLYVTEIIAEDIEAVFPAKDSERHTAHTSSVKMKDNVFDDIPF